MSDASTPFNQRLPLTPQHKDVSQFHKHLLSLFFFFFAPGTENKQTRPLSKGAQSLLMEKKLALV